MPIKDEYGNWEEWTVIPISIILFFIAFIAILSPFILINKIGATKGEHTGLITAVERNDNLLWDADLIYFKSSDESTQEDIYCIEEGLIEKAKELGNKKQIVTISFENNFWFMRWNCNGGISIVKDIK